MRPALARTNTTLWWIACALVCAVYVFSVPRVWQCEGVDEIEYLGLAHSIARGFGYSLYGQPYVVYPPLYPLVLSVILDRGPGLWRCLYAANALFGAVALIIGATWLRSRFGRAGSWAGWFTIVSYFAWSFSTRYLLSEPLYFVLSLVVLIPAWRVLCEDRARGWMVLLVAAGSLLCAATRFGAVALTAAVCLSALVKWIRTRSRVALLFLFLVGILGGGFAVAWEARARMVDPGAVESYARWTRKVIGVSSESAGMIAQSVGEGTDAKKSWPERAVALGVRYGQYVLSNVRVPAVAVPFALFLGLVFLTGLILHLIRCAWSPVGWYTAISLAVISLTSWFSSYTRYLYPLTPFLFLFLLEGARAWRTGVFGRGAAWMRLCLVLCGVGGLIGSIMNWPFDGRATAEGAYVAAVAGLCVLAYAAMVVVGIRPGRATEFAMNDRIVGACMAALILAAALQTSMVVAARSRLTSQNHTLVQRNLAGLVSAGAWLSGHSAPQAACVSSLPRLTAFLSDRNHFPAKYTDQGALDLSAVDYVVAMGRLVDVPAFRPAEEDRLAQAVDAALREQELVRVFADGDAAVYRVAKP